ncbi:MAG: MFS transporter [Chroococcidiopsidaceae cyanobacterium CP_BM_ER_R8_30]|nr:MFS transporter [Chroococcidiopsidaceae cyanobacterium CP_BM_ER_R8_30]
MRSQQRISVTNKTQTFAFAAICCGFLMVVVDAAIVNVAVPDIGRVLGDSISSLQWVINSYTLMLASVLLTAGALGDRFGAKRIYLLGLALFTLTSLLCSLSTTLNLLIIARFIQGLGGAMLIPGSLSLIAYAYPEPKARARAVGIWATISSVGFAASPVLGGLLVDTLGWRSIFWVNLPVGLFALALTWRFVVETPRNQRHSIDLAGQILAIVALFTLTFALIEGQHLGWKTPLILAAFLIFAVAATLFALVESRSRHPMLPLALFAVPAFSTANVVGLFFNFCLYGQIFVFSLFLQNIRGDSAITTGLAFLPLTVAGFLAPPLSGRLTAHFGSRLPMALGLTLSGIGSLVLTSVGTTTSYRIIAIGFMLFGFGTGMTMPAMTTTVLASAPSEQSGIASAILNSMRQVGGVLGVAVLGVFVSGTSFVKGLHLALFVVALTFFIGCTLTLIYVPNGKLRHR